MQYLSYFYPSSQSSDQQFNRETEQRLNDFLIFLSGVQKGQKININNFTTISSSGCYSSLYRMSMGENKNSTLSTIKALSCFIMKNILQRKFNTEFCLKVKGALKGIENLKQTYYELDSGKNSSFCEELSNIINDLKMSIDRYEEDV